MSTPDESDTESISSSGTTRGGPFNTPGPSSSTRLPVSSVLSPVITSSKDNPTMSLTDGNESIKVFGTGIQQFAQRLSAALARFNISVRLTDSNFNDWAPPIVESLQTLCLNLYLTSPNYREETMTLIRHDKLREILTTWILSHMDVNNGRRSRAHLTSYSNGVMSTDYDPHKLWSFINSYHCSITKARLNVITSTLHGLKQDSSESLTTYFDKFNLVLSEYFKFGGELSEMQAA